MAIYRFLIGAFLFAVGIYACARAFNYFACAAGLLGLALLYSCMVLPGGYRE